MPRVHAVRALQRATAQGSNYMEFRSGWYYFTPSDLTFVFGPHVVNSGYTTLAALLDSGLRHSAPDFQEYFNTFLRVMGSYVGYAPTTDFPPPADYSYTTPIYRTTHRVYYSRGFVPQVDILSTTSWISIYVR